MAFLCATAILGGGLTVVGTWSVLGLWSLFAAPFGGSLLTLGAALLLDYPAQVDPDRGAKPVKLKASIADAP